MQRPKMSCNVISLMPITKGRVHVRVFLRCGVGVGVGVGVVGVGVVGVGLSGGVH